MIKLRLDNGRIFIVDEPEHKPLTVIYDRYEIVKDSKTKELYIVDKTKKAGLTACFFYCFLKIAVI